LGDVEIHFQHYATEQECVDKWTERLKKVNWDNLFFLFTDRDNCTQDLIRAFDQLTFQNKLCFTAKAHPAYNSCVQIKEYQDQACVGDLYRDFSILEKYIDFTAWLGGGSGTKTAR
jgi:uncharacterized protein (DUF1919 family)